MINDLALASGTDAFWQRTSALHGPCVALSLFGRLYRPDNGYKTTPNHPFALSNQPFRIGLITGPQRHSVVPHT